MNVGPLFFCAFLWTIHFLTFKSIILNTVSTFLIFASCFKIPFCSHVLRGMRFRIGGVRRTHRSTWHFTLGLYLQNNSRLCVFTCKLNWRRSHFSYFSGFLELPRFSFFLFFLWLRQCCAKTVDARCLDHKTVGRGRLKASFCSAETQRLCSANRRQRPLKYHLASCSAAAVWRSVRAYLVCICMKYWFPMRFPFFFSCFFWWGGEEWRGHPPPVDLWVISY